jgi:hypothetical protein
MDRGNFLFLAARSSVIIPALTTHKTRSFLVFTLAARTQVGADQMPPARCQGRARRRPLATSQKLLSLWLT